MRILERKAKGAVQVKAAGEKVYVAPGTDKEREYLKYAVHLLSNDLLRAVYRLEAAYVFAKRNHDEITVDEKKFADDSEAKFEIDTLFEGRAAEVFDESEVADIRRGDRKIVLSALLAASVVIMYIGFKSAEPKKDMVSGNVTHSSHVDLNNSEKEIARVMGTKEVAERVSHIVSTARSDADARIAVLTVQRAEGPMTVSYIVTTTKDYLYPETGSVSKEKGLWEKSCTENIVLGKKDLKAMKIVDFDVCSLRMLNSGFNVRERKDRCVNFVFDGDAARTVDQSTSIAGCYVFLNSLNIASGIGKLDVTLCKNQAIGNML